MTTSPPVIEGHDARTVERAVAALRAGGVVLLPTDTVYGIAALPGDAAATRQLFELKGRERDTPIAVLCASTAQALALADPDAGDAVRPVAARWWPGPLTLVLPRRAGVELHLGEPSATVGLRVPEHTLVRAVAEQVGPLATTSANRSGHPPPGTAVAAARSLAGDVALVVDGGPLTGEASTVIDATQRPWRVLRPGPLPIADILQH